MPKTKDHLQFFSDTKEIFLYGGLSHAQGTAKHILKLDYQEASKIRKAARQRALLSKADYNSRSRQMFNAIVRGRSKEK